MIASEDRASPRAQAAPRTGTTDRGYLWRQRLIRAFIHAGLILWAILCVYPMLFTVLSALKLSPELYANPFALPTRWVWGNFRDAWSFGHMGQYFFNSVVVTGVSTVLVLFLGSTCGFALARFDFPLKPVVWSYILFGFLIPGSLMLVPLAIFTRTLGIYDSLLGPALVYAAAGVPFHTFFLRAFMETIPRELEEAAVMDGAGMWTVYWHVVMPLSRPALTTMGTFNILYAWSEFILALVLTGTTAARTMPVGVSMLEQVFVSNQPTVAAGAVISIIPAFLIFAFLQRYVVAGLTAGALKA